MERKNLEAGKKAAQDLAPKPTEHTPEAPIISEQDAQVIESPSGASPGPREDEKLPNDIRRRQAPADHKADSGGFRITPDE